MATTYGIRTARTRHASRLHDEGHTGYNVNFYQPMMQYLEAKTSQMNVAPPRVPWSSTRGMRQYVAPRPTRQYTTDQVIKLSREVTNRADQIMAEFRAKKNRPFSSTLIAEKHHGRHTPDPETMVEMSEQRRLRRQQDLENLIRQDTIQILQRIKRLELDNVDMDQELKRHIRGKSSDQIAQALLVDAERNIRQGKQKEDRFLAAAAAVARGSSCCRSPSVDTRDTRDLALEWMDERAVQALEKKLYSSSLRHVKRDLANLNTKTVEFYQGTKCDLEEKCWVCRKVLRTHPKVKDYSYLYWR